MLQMELIKYKISNSSWGNCLTAYSGKGLCALFLGESSSELASALSARFPLAQCEWLESLPYVDFMLPYEGALDLRGTPFQLQVWDALRQIPRGKTCSYRHIAEQLGRPRAVRAVAGACGANPIAGIIPCHRVIRTDGKLSGYRWGVQIKEQLLNWEQAHAAEA